MAVGVRPQRGAPPPFPHSPQLSSSSPGRGGGTWSGAGRGRRPESARGAPQLRVHAAPRNFVVALQVWGLAEVCMWGARASRRAAAAPSGPCWSSPREQARRKVCALSLILEKNAGPEARYPASIAPFGRIPFETKPH